MNSPIEIVGVAELVERGLAHPRHDSHVQHDVEAIGQLDANLRQRRPERAHHVGQDVHRAPAHRAVEPSAQLRVSLDRVGPVVSRPRINFVRRTNEGQLFGACDVVGVRSMQVAARAFLLIQFDEYSCGDCLFGEPIFFGF